MGFHCSLGKCIVISSYLRLGFQLVGKSLKLRKLYIYILTLYIYILSSLFPCFLLGSVAFVSQPGGSSLPSEDVKFEFFWPRLELILSFHSTWGIRLLFNVNHLSFWLSFCMRMALGLLCFSFMDDMCKSDVFEKSDQLGPVSAESAWFENVQTA